MPSTKAEYVIAYALGDPCDVLPRFTSPLQLTADDLDRTNAPTLYSIGGLFPQLRAEQQSDAAAPNRVKSVAGDVVDRTLKRKEGSTPHAGAKSTGAAPGELTRLLKSSASNGDLQGMQAQGPNILIIIYCPNAERTALRVAVPETATVSYLINAALRQAAATAAKDATAGKTAAQRDRYAWLLSDVARRQLSGATTPSASALAAVYKDLQLDGRAWELRLHDSAGEPDLDFPALDRSRPIRNFAAPESGARTDGGSGRAETVVGEYCLLRSRRTSSTTAPVNGPKTPQLAGTNGQPLSPGAQDKRPKDAASLLDMPSLLLPFNLGPPLETLRVLLQLPNHASHTVILVPYNIKQVEARAAWDKKMAAEDSRRAYGSPYEDAGLGSSRGGPYDYGRPADHRATTPRRAWPTRSDALVFDQQATAGQQGYGQAPSRDGYYDYDVDSGLVTSGGVPVLTVSDVIAYVGNRYRLPLYTEKYLLRMSAADAAKFGLTNTSAAARELPVAMDLYPLRVDTVELVRKQFLDTPQDKLPGLGIGPAKTAAGQGGQGAGGAGQGGDGPRYSQWRPGRAADGDDDDDAGSAGEDLLDDRFYDGRRGDMGYGAEEVGAYQDVHGPLAFAAGGGGPGGGIGHGPGGPMFEPASSLGDHGGSMGPMGANNITGWSYAPVSELGRSMGPGGMRGWTPSNAAGTGGGYYGGPGRGGRELSAAAAGAYQEWLLVKINKHGRRQNRVLGIDGTRLTNRKLDKNMKNGGSTAGPGGGQGTPKAGASGSGGNSPVAGQGSDKDAKERLVSDIIRVEVPDDSATRFVIVFRSVDSPSALTPGGHGGSAGGFGVKQGGSGGNAGGTVSQGLRALGRGLTGIAGAAKAAVGMSGGSGSSSAGFGPGGSAVGAGMGGRDSGDETRVIYDARTEAERDEIVGKLWTLLRFSGEAHRVVRVVSC